MSSNHPNVESTLSTNYTVSVGAAERRGEERRRGGEEEERRGAEGGEEGRSAPDRGLMLLTAVSNALVMAVSNAPVMAVSNAPDRGV